MNVDKVQQTHSLVDPQASSISYACEKEAEKLFQAETKQDSLPTLAGMALLYVSLTCHGEGKKGTDYLVVATQAAERMNLFGVFNVLATLESALDQAESKFRTSSR
ncbi:hypothetical protein B0J11DRAFT_194207 [Dendryphion nanum]|uniref:Uncharacterized protein n=1 Tax=Dendryphion nanum TaxID=256645 RepID=A0A9P9I9C1_9PLEO|nr:hypothetical protein B0J11DRAFT_194207 [Dendryphion nanum]